MKKLYFLDEQEKNRILNLHTEATKNQYLVNKKLLMEGWPAPNTLLSLGKIFRKGVEVNKKGKITNMGDNFAEAFTNYKTFNPAVVTALDDALKGLSNDFIHVSGSLQGLMTKGDNFISNITLENLIKYNPMTKKGFKPGVKPTPQQIDDFLNDINFTIKNTDGTKTKNLKTLLGGKLKQQADNWDANISSLPSKTGTLGKIQAIGQGASGLAKKYPKTTVGGAAVVGTLLTSAAYNSLGKGSSTKEEAISIRDTIGTYCNQWNLNSMNSKSEASGTKAYNSILAAGDAWYGTYSSGIYNSIVGLTGVTSVCKMAQLFDKNQRTEWENKIELVNGKIGHGFASFIYYEYTGTLEFLSTLQSYVSVPLKNKIADFQQIYDEEYADGSKPTPDPNKPSPNTPPPPAQQSELDKLLTTYPKFKNYPCVIDLYKSKGGIINMSGNYGYIEIENTIYYRDGQLQIRGDNNESDAYDFTCVSGKPEKKGGKVPFRS
jgi:hypothetical protein